MKVEEALLYCRQLLFEQRITGAWLGADRLELALALQRWRTVPADNGGDQMDEVARNRWKQEAEDERFKSLERARRDARLHERTQARLAAAEDILGQLRSENDLLREQLTACRMNGELENELEIMRVERSERKAAGQRAARQEEVLRGQLKAEERRLANASAHIAVLEKMADDDEVSLQVRHTAEINMLRKSRELALTRLRASRHGTGCHDFGRLAWAAAACDARLQVALQRHDRQLHELELRREMLVSLRDSREELEWRVTRTKAQCIVVRSAADTQSAPG